MSDENWSLSIFDDEISNELRCDWSLSTEEWDFLFVHDNLEKLEKIFHLFNRDKSIVCLQNNIQTQMQTQNIQHKFISGQ